MWPGAFSAAMNAGLVCPRERHTFWVPASEPACLIRVQLVHAAYCNVSPDWGRQLHYCTPGQSEVSSCPTEVSSNSTYPVLNATLWVSLKVALLTLLWAATLWVCQVRYDWLLSVFAYGHHVQEGLQGTGSVHGCYAMAWMRTASSCRCTPCCEQLTSVQGCSAVLLCRT